ncbi:type IV conjugative transfer system coupling protein TraD [Serratia fonticola]|uniref:type IV conjugative transfer system coupling protein TraD n=1 Tax=Serratia fonticola TaxID=47917 RepID=UPI001376C23E|nr:type IV conjugative transfer system coupling protein TraD [Serratia fonticola]NCG53663.1 type IV conjugative transfer system coupling protein TraD [Serratia fonticola]
MSFNAKDMTQGGQIAFMRLRMFTQISNLVFYCMFLLFGVVIGLTLLMRLSWQNFENGMIYWWCYMVEGFPSVSPAQSIYHLSYYGKTLTYTGQQVLADAYTTFCGQLVKRELIFAALLGIVVTVIAGGVAIWVLGRQGKEQSEDEITGGRTLTDDPASVARMLKRDGVASDIRIDGLPIIKNSEVKNFCIMGSVGTGKSRLYRKLMDYARKRGDMVIVFDKSCDFVKDYYDPQYDKILNPLDARCVAWDLWSECLTLPDFENVADILIPMGSNEDPFWQGSARTIFVEAAYRMRLDKDRSYAKLLNTLLSIDLPRLRAYLEGTPASNLVDGKIEKTAISIRSVLTNYAKALRYMQGLETLGTPFTIRDWMRGVKDNGKNGWLFLTSDASSHKSLKPLISMWLSIASHSLLSMGENPERRVWIFADEIPTLHKLPDLVTIVPEARKFGGCFALGFQTYSQLEDIYGVKAASSIFGVLRTRFFFSVPDKVGAEFAAGEVGEKEYRKASEQYSYGADPVRDGVSVGKDIERMQLVSYSDIQMLPDLCCYVTLPGPYPAIKLQMVYKKVKQVARPYELRKIDEDADSRLATALEEREQEIANTDVLFNPGIVPPPTTPVLGQSQNIEVIVEEPLPAQTPQQTTTTTNDSNSDAAAGQESVLKNKPVQGNDDPKRDDLPAGISADGEIIDPASYEAWMAQQESLSQRSMHRKEEININHSRQEQKDTEIGEMF